MSEELAGFRERGLDLMVRLVGTKALDFRAEKILETGNDCALYANKLLPRLPKISHRGRRQAIHERCTAAAEER
jgi:hypothetical protein